MALWPDEEERAAAHGAGLAASLRTASSWQLQEGGSADAAPVTSHAQQQEEEQEPQQQSPGIELLMGVADEAAHAGAVALAQAWHAYEFHVPRCACGGVLATTRRAGPCGLDARRRPPIDARPRAGPWRGAHTGPWSRGATRRCALAGAACSWPPGPAHPSSHAPVLCARGGKLQAERNASAGALLSSLADAGVLDVLPLPGGQVAGPWPHLQVRPYSRGGGRGRRSFHTRAPFGGCPGGHCWRTALAARRTRRRWPRRLRGSWSRWRHK